MVRDLHRWGGELLLIAAWLHLFRVFVVGAYRRVSGWTVSVGGGDLDRLVDGYRVAVAL